MTTFEKNEIETLRAAAVDALTEAARAASQAAGAAENRAFLAATLNQATLGEAAAKAYAADAAKAASAALDIYFATKAKADAEAD
jgi:hypothetical protein